MLRHNFIGNALAEAMCQNIDHENPRLIYCDWIEEQGDSVMAEHLRIWVPGDGYDGDGYDGDGYDGDGYGGDGCGGGGDGCGGGGYGDGGYGYGGGGYGDGGCGDGGYGGGGGGYGGGGGGYGGGGVRKIHLEAGEMKDGEISIVTVPGGYYPYVSVGRLRHLGGLEWELVGARIIRRFGPNVTLATLADKGPQRGTELLPPAVKPESIWRPNVGRCLPCNEAVWDELIPKDHRIEE